MTRPARACIFDVDGLLLDTEIIYTRVTQEIVSRYNREFNWQLKAEMIGRPAIESARYLVATLQLPLTPEDYLVERNRLMRPMFAECEALPGAEKLVRHLHAHKIPIGVATSSQADLYAIKISRHAWFDLFDAVITGDDARVKHGKPAPDIFCTAAAELGAAAREALVFEDAPAGLAAGIAADMRVIAVPDKHMDAQRYAAACEVLDDLTAFLPEKYGLPAFAA